MSKDAVVRMGVVGLGNMGSCHVRWIKTDVPGMKVTAVCDTNPEKLKNYDPSEYALFANPQDLFDSGKVDAVLIATPHYDHTTLGIAALKAGLHVLVEKPISVHKADCERLIAAHTNKKQVFAAMFNQRTNPCYRKLRAMIQGGELGALRRIQWTITDWYRTETYYKSGGWRATWAGEGGGVLLNQCPHQLDLWQWLFGMPRNVRAFIGIGRFHNIEVEDDVTAYMEYDNGCTGVFITTTGEAPGTNRLEVAGDRGKVVIENLRIEFTRNEVPVSEHLRTSPGSFSRPDIWNVHVPTAGGDGDQHRGILRNFADAILKGDELIARAEEGIHSVELANAMIQSGLTGQTITLPMDAAAYEKLLKQKIATSTYVKETIRATVDDFSKSM